MAGANPTLERHLRLSYREAHAVIRGVATRVFHGAVDDMDDAIQCVWARVLEALRRDVGPAHNPRAWLRSTTHHTLLNYQRRTTDVLTLRESLRSLDEMVGQGDVTAPHSGELDPLLRSQVLRAVSVCSHRQRLIIRMRLRGESGHVIARALGVSPALVSREISRIYRVLRVELQCPET